jgi:hypothetical protein
MGALTRAPTPKNRATKRDAISLREMKTLSNAAYDEQV